MLPYVVAGLVVVALGTLVWFIRGRGPRLRRAHRRSQNLLRAGQWREALAAVRDMQALAPLPAQWEGRVRNAEGECLRAAGVAALAEKDYEKGLEHHVAAARLLGLNEAEVRGQVIGSMLGEVYHLFAAGTEEVQRLLARILILQSPCPEASFWLGLCHIRTGRTELALKALNDAHEGNKTFIDPPLYLGTFLLRSGQVPDALRYLADANRIDSNCPFVAWQLGTAITTARGDAGLAVRALQKALGPKGLPLWVRTPEKAWAEGMPGPTRSYVSRLAAQHPFLCPLLGNDVAVMVRQAFFTLSQAQYRLGNFEESAGICANLMQEAAPSVPLLRGLGLALARLERYDEAFKHLRAAHEQEDPKNALTAGYLAMCGARGKPSRAEDKPSNVLWAARLLARFDRPGDVEWAGLNRAVYTEARAVGLTLGVEDLARGCEVLASVDAADAEAAATYDQLAAYPGMVKPVHAFLYCRAAQQHGTRGQHDLDLFNLAFSQLTELQSFYRKREWGLEELEATYLARWADANPGRFPDVLGPDYPPVGERLLMERSEQQEAAGQSLAALASADALSKLMPHNGKALDRLACLHYRRGELADAARVLSTWAARHPHDPVPSLRLAVVERQRGHGPACAKAIERALDLAQGSYRAEVAYLGARLALAELAPAPDNGETAREEVRGRVVHFLHECLREQRDHAGALGLLAALHWQSGDRQALVDHAPWLNRPEVPDPRFQLFAAVAHLAAENHSAALDAAERASADAGLELESRYLIGLSQLRRGDYGSAVAALEKVARSPETPSVHNARAVLGTLHFRAGAFESASHWWQMLDPARRTALKLDETLRSTVFLAALQAYETGRFEHAADKLREAGRLGCRDRRLGPLLHLSLFKAGQRLYYLARSNSHGHDLLDSERLSEAAQFLNQALTAGAKDPAVPYLLAMAYKHRENTKDARAALRRVGESDANVWLQMGLLSLADRLPAQAEPEFLRAWEMDPECFAAGANLLLTRLSLGQVEAAETLTRSVMAKAPPKDARFFDELGALLRCTPSLNGDGRHDPILNQMNAEEEHRLLAVLRGLGHIDTVCMLLRLLATTRPGSSAAREAAFEAVLLKGKKSVDRCDWSGAHGLLKLLVRQREAAPATLAALFNLLGCCSCLCQDFAEGAKHFTTAVRLAPDDPGIHQNLALAYEWLRDPAQSEPHWNRYFDLLERHLTPSPHSPDSVAPLLFEGLHRLATNHTEKERWANALPYLERAHRLQPDDPDTLERLFSLYSQLRRLDDARRVLHRLRHIRPGEGQFDLYELDLVELRDVDDIDRWVGDVGRVVQNFPGQTRVEERALNMIGNMVPLLAKTSDQLTEQLNKVMRQVRGLQNYQINWQAVHEVMRDLKREFQKVRRTVGKCLAVITHPEHRRILRSLGEHVDRKIEFCREWQGN